MDFQTFARLHGVLIDRLIEDGKWHRVPTESHPKKKNGAYRSMGTYAHLQDHAAHPEPILWQPDATEIAKVDHAAIARRAAEAAAQIRRDQAEAAKRAGWILHQCRQAPHPYLAAKGFPEERGNVWDDEKTGAAKLCIPMRADGRVVGLQTISDQPAHERFAKDGSREPVPAFEKRFLYGQRTDQAVYVIDNHGTHVFCEGVATGLSVRDALLAMKVRFTLHICFTAGNMLKVATNFDEGIVIADYDMPSKQHPHEGGHGIAVAKQIGLPYWQSDRAGEDANDLHQRAGLFRLTQGLKVLFMRRRAA